jgi:TetR/AcrR family transcriptional repressor of nem operon
MGYSQAQKAESRVKVLEAAAQKIRENGIEALGVADCMRSAGLTHGAFYGHFESRDALIIEALEHAVELGNKRIDALANNARNRSKTPLQGIVESYLGEAHVANPGNGCALCALAGEARHANAATKAVLTRHVHSLALRLAEAAGGSTEAEGLGITATIIGAITLARTVDDAALARSILSNSIALVLSQDRNQKAA